MKTPEARVAVRFGIASKLALIVGGLLFSLLSFTTIVESRAAAERTREALERQGDAIASTLNHTLEVLVDEGALVQLQRVTANTVFLPDMRDVTVVNKQGKVIACTDRTQLGAMTASAHVREILGREDFQPLVREAENEIVIVRPLFSGHYKSGTDTGLVGAVEVVLDRRAMQAEADSATRRTLFIQFGAYGLLSALVALLLRTIVAKPLEALSNAAHRMRLGDHTARAGVRSLDELGAVSLAFDEMAAEIGRTVDTLEENVAARTLALKEALEERSRANEDLQKAQRELELSLEERSRVNEDLKSAKKDLEAALDDSMQANEALALAHTDLARTHDELVVSVEEQRRLADAVRELSTPVLRVYRGILTMPLVGHIDEARAAQIEEKLLAGIDRHDAEEVILDLSGVPFVDVDVARALVRAQRCAELVGARVSLVGLRSDVAMSVVRAGIDLSSLSTRADLESALVRALRRRGYELRQNKAGR